MSKMVSDKGIGYDLRHPKPPKLDRARIDESIDGALLDALKKIAHSPNIQSEVNFDIYISCKCQNNLACKEWISIEAFI
jgi:hypothetical protein